MCTFGSPGLEEKYATTHWLQYSLILCTFVSSENLYLPTLYLLPFWGVMYLENFQSDMYQG